MITPDQFSSVAAQIPRARNTAAPSSQTHGGMRSIAAPYDDDAGDFYQRSTSGATLAVAAGGAASPAFAGAAEAHAAVAARGAGVAVHGIAVTIVIIPGDLVERVLIAASLGIERYRRDAVRFVVGDVEQREAGDDGERLPPALERRPRRDRQGAQGPKVICISVLVLVSVNVASPFATL